MLSRGFLYSALIRNKQELFAVVCVQLCKGGMFVRKIAVCFLVMAFVVLAAVPVYAQDRQLRQHHTIEIEVECLYAATEVIRGLNGYNLEASVFLNESFRHGAQRWGAFERRVEYWAYSHVQEVLRGLGDVVYESQSALFLGAQIMDADARITALTQEMERLSVMLAASDNLNVLITIDSRLSQVALERNQVIGTRNVLIAQAANPVINIRLHEIPEGRPAVMPDRFGSRVADMFMLSLRTTGTVLGHMLVFAARVFIPVLVFAGLALPVVYVCLKARKRRKETFVFQMADGRVLAAVPTAELSEASWVKIPQETAFTSEAEVSQMSAGVEEEEGEK